MKRSVWLERLAVAVAAFLTVVGIGSFGMWEPWELESRPVIDLSFDLFGISEVSARLPGVLAGLAMGTIAFVLLRSAVNRRAGVIAVVVLVSTPLFLLNARLAMGDAIGMTAQAWVGASAMSVGWARQPRGRRMASWIVLAMAAAVSSAASGVLLGPLPPLLAVTAWILLSRGDEVSAITRWLLPSVSVVLVVGVIHAVREDAPEMSRWLGGGAIGGTPPTWDAALELVFHAFAPWSAVLLIAIVSTLGPRPDRSPGAQRIAWIALLWAGFGFASWTVLASRYGTPPFLPVLPLAILVSLWLTEADDDASAPRWTAAVTIVLLVGLQIRDYALYPDSALRGLSAASLSMPEIYHPSGGWTLAFSMTALTLGLFLVSPGTTEPPNHGRTVQWLRAKWDAGWPERGWLLLLVGLVGASFAFGLMSFLLEMEIASLVKRIGRAMFFTPFVLAAAIFGLPWLRHLYGRLGTHRIFPVLAVALSTGAFIALWFQPALSRHFSSKPVYESYGELSGDEPGPLAAYRVSTTAARYYTDASIAEISDRDALIEYLSADDRRWAILPTDQLPSLDRAYRRKTGRHVYVADARSAWLLLAASNALPGRPNQNVIAEVVHTDMPKVEHPVEARYGGRVELVGLDLDLPEASFVGAGQRFSLTWYWHVIGEPPRGYEVFVHIDGSGLRLNGDHEPLDGRYPMKLWERGDVLADRQTLTVPANFPSGDYVIYVGWFAGGKRLPVESGPQDGDDRVRAGVLPVR